MTPEQINKHVLLKQGGKNSTEYSVTRLGVDQILLLALNNMKRASDKDKRLYQQDDSKTQQEFAVAL